VAIPELIKNSYGAKAIEVNILLSLQLAPSKEKWAAFGMVALE